MGKVTKGTNNNEVDFKREGTTRQMPRSTVSDMALIPSTVTQDVSGLKINITQCVDDLPKPSVDATCSVNIPVHFTFSRTLNSIKFQDVSGVSEVLVHFQCPCFVVHFKKFMGACYCTV